ncbi:hypothetical protein YC2023_016379 [Brassica napus]
MLNMVSLLEKIEDRNWNMCLNDGKESLPEVKLHGQHDILMEKSLICPHLCVLGNLCPETAEEAVAMVPFLKLFCRQKEELTVSKQLRRCSMISPLSRDSNSAKNLEI